MKKTSGYFRSKKMVAVVALVGVLLLSSALLLRGEAGGDYKKATFARLERVRDAKRERIVEYFNETRRLAKEIKDDEVMLRFFDEIRRSGSGAKGDLEYRIDEHYVSHYGNFYDILFVDSTGYVFHSIRKESDYQKNFFESHLAETRLAQRMKEKRRDIFVEYEYYPPSDEPAAFFVAPLRDGAENPGWFVLQSPINRINTILTERSDLGRSGEVYLVNQDKLMLSDSRFVDDSTILRLKVDTWAVKKALRDSVGERIIRDYRGINVFSSFERFDIFGTSWIIIAEIDEDEVITEHYKRNAGRFAEMIYRQIAAAPRKKQAVTHIERRKKRVDINEFAKGLAGEVLYTSGVATCTAIAVLLPGKFGYLAHITPTDEIYIANELSGFFLGDQHSDFLGELIGKIEHFDVYPYELKELEIASSLRTTGALPAPSTRFWTTASNCRG